MAATKIKIDETVAIFCHFPIQNIAPPILIARVAAIKRPVEPGAPTVEKSTDNIFFKIPEIAIISVNPTRTPLKTSVRRSHNDHRTLVVMASSDRSEEN